MPGRMARLVTGRRSKYLVVVLVLVVAGGLSSQAGKVVLKGGASTVTATLRPGRYVFYCSVAGHEAGGMKGVLTVR